MLHVTGRPRVIRRWRLLPGSAPPPSLSRRLRQPREKNQEVDAKAPTVHAVEMSCIPLLMEPACSSSGVQGAAKTRNNDAISRFLNTSEFPLETAMRDMEGSGKIGTTNSGNSLEKNDRQLHGKWSKRVGQISSKHNRIKEAENKEHIAGSTSQQAHWGRTCPCLDAQEGILEPDANLDCNTGISDSARSADASESSKQMQHKRTPCKYGSGCYRKNPIHFQQFSHPNDDDYHKMEMVAQDDNDSQPECPYGTACYRKKPQHKLEYRHSAPPGKRAVKKDSVNYGEASEYDLNDRFMDEEEECEPTDEDSDWEPSSDEKDNEDVDARVQETCRFVRINK